MRCGRILCGGVAEPRAPSTHTNGKIVLLVLLTSWRSEASSSQRFDCYYLFFFLKLLLIWVLSSFWWSWSFWSLWFWVFWKAVIDRDSCWCLFYSFMQLYYISASMGPQSQKSVFGVHPIFRIFFFNSGWPYLLLFLLLIGWWIALLRFLVVAVLVFLLACPEMSEAAAGLGRLQVENF